MWKLQDFSVTQILREIKLGESTGSVKADCIISMANSGCIGADN